MTARVVVEDVAWPVLGAQVAVVRDGRVLVQLRPWPPGWELPGGHCEEGENPAVTAAREAEEETGYRIRIVSLVGVYTWSGLRTVGDVLYVGEITGGRSRRSLEAWATRFVGLDELPRTLFPWLRQRIADSLEVWRGGPPVHRVQPVTLYHVAAFSTAWMQSPIDRLLHWMRRDSA
ncbi:MAG: NUDIX domain-containing protein [Candidatus Dormibacteraeota bacterium]|nr:NUDIX domain-containing protein [Candidatus Dormibacteraeota bacterium]